MKKCSKCGAQISEYDTVCPKCCATQISLDAYFNRSTPRFLDDISIGLCLLSVLIPVFGITYWVIKYDDAPKKATACGITAILTTLVSFFAARTYLNYLFELLKNISY